MSINANRTTDRPALVALFGLGLIFTVIVGYGWARMFLYWNLPVLPYLAGVGLALVALALSYATAAERVHSGRINSVAAAYFFVLFLISSLGTINTLFINFSGVSIMREAIASAQEALNNLKNKTPQILATPEWDRFEANVNVKLRALQAEIQNPRLCGQGPVAIQIMEELVSLLPNFRRLSGYGCSNIPEVVSEYEKKVRDLLKSSPEYQDARKKIEIREKVISNSTNALRSLDAAAKTLTGVSDISDAKAVLYESADRYAIAKQDIDSALKEPSSLPNKIDTSAASALGNIGQVVTTIFSRLLDFATYFYVLVALMLDIIMVIAFQRVLQVGRNPAARLRGAAVNII